MDRRFCSSQENFIKGVIFPELELIISDVQVRYLSLHWVYNGLTIVNFVIVYLKLSLYYIDCIFSLSFLPFNPSFLKFNVIRVSVKMGAFNVTGKKPFFLFLAISLVFYQIVF